MSRARRFLPGRRVQPVATLRTYRRPGGSPRLAPRAAHWPIVLASALVFVGVALLQAQEARPDFSGTWTLDISRSSPGPLPPPESLEAVIEHKEPTITSTLTQRGPDGVVTSRTTITTDGQENRNTTATADGEAVLISRSRWSGRTLIIATSTTVQGTAVGVTESWSLSADGTALVVSRAFSSDQGAFQQRFVFTRH